MRLLIRLKGYNLQFSYLTHWVTAPLLCLDLILLGAYFIIRHTKFSLLLLVLLQYNIERTELLVDWPSLIIISAITTQHSWIGLFPLLALR